MRDSYGTRANGQRGLFEILADLGIRVERTLGPPTAVVGRNVTLVLWKPHPDLVQGNQPTCTLSRGGSKTADASWSPRTPDAPLPGRSGCQDGDWHTRESTVLGELGLATVSVQTIDLTGPEKGAGADPAGPFFGTARLSK